MKPIVNSIDVAINVSFGMSYSDLFDANFIWEGESGRVELISYKDTSKDTMDCQGQ